MSSERLDFEIYDFLSLLNFHVCSYEVKILSYDINLLHIGLINFDFMNVYKVPFFPSLINKVPPYFVKSKSQKCKQQN